MVKKVNNKKNKKIKITQPQRVSTNYPVGDFLIRVKNAALAGRQEISVPNTKLAYAVAKVLEKEGFLSGADTHDYVLTVKVARHAKESKLLGLTLISRPGLRRYMSVDRLSKLRGPETYIITTSKGVMSSKDALKNSLGGEVIAKVW